MDKAELIGLSETLGELLGETLDTFISQLDKICAVLEMKQPLLLLKFYTHRLVPLVTVLPLTVRLPRVTPSPLRRRRVTLSPLRLPQVTPSHRPLELLPELLLELPLEQLEQLHRLHLLL